MTTPATSTAAPSTGAAPTSTGTGSSGAAPSSPSKGSSAALGTTPAGRSPRLPPLKTQPGAATAPGSTSAADASASARGAAPDVGAPAGRTAKEVAKDAAARREAVMWKHRLEDGTELEIDIADAIAGHKRKVKVDGEEVEVGLDDAFRSFERVRASMKRFDEAAAIKKDAETKIARAEAREAKVRETLSDPTKALPLVKRILGEDLYYRAIAEDVADRVKYERLPPEQRSQVDRQRKAQTEAERVEAQLAARKAELDRREREFSEREGRTHVDRARAEITAELEHARLPVTQTTIGLLARVKAQAARAGTKLSPEEAVAEVRSELRSMMSGLAADPSALRELLGENGADALRQAELARLQEQPGRRAPGETVRGGPKAPPRSGGGGGKPRSLEAFQEQLRARRAG